MDTNIVTGTPNQQGMRIFRRLADSFVVSKTLPTSGTGLLIPSNYNPKLDYLKIAKKAGLL